MDPILMNKILDRIFRIFFHFPDGNEKPPIAFGEKIVT